ncbi:carboxymuconolactone decarboxylase family protein [Nocardiopsis sp. NPDC050513]|uniref:carboxymuconolactone decarboxylase family protein n=1 Tax=Nocardiopsis sp. NPDC050513 TaxID=3364338 RepID=UPI00379B369C
MARLPDPGQHATPEVRSEMERMAAVRSHADGRARLAEVYAAMFNNPDVARAVGELGERLRFRGVLPDELRETAILRFAARRGLDYEWAHHVRPATQAGLPAAYIDALADTGVPAGLTRVQHTVVLAVDHVADGAEIPDDVQSVLVEAVGVAGVVELVALCGLYALMGYMCTAFGIGIEPGLPSPPWAEDTPTAEGP